jgi:fermentation-respiration switch protein FrsA (DUF1100 family)
MTSLRRTLVVGLAVLALAAVPALADNGNGNGNGNAYGKNKPKPKPAALACVGDPSAALPLTFMSGGQRAQALYVLPSVKPRGIVVFDHGYSHTMYSWVRHLQRTARTLGVIAVAPDYRGQVNDLKAKPYPSSRGWRVAEGAVDTNTVAQLFDKLCLKGGGHNVLYSVSMGGNTAGLALAAKPKRLKGKPLFDEWVDVEGAANVLETYQGARLLAPVNTFAAHAQADIEAEMGGTPEQVPQVYAERTVVNRVDDIAASGIKGVVMVHGVMDGLVTHDISRQLQALLLGYGVPVDMTAFVTRTTGTEPGTTLDGYAPTGQTSPFAGHASEVSETHDVGLAGFAKLAELYKGKAVACSDVTKDGQTGQSVGGSYPCP